MRIAGLVAFVLALGACSQRPGPETAAKAPSAVPAAMIEVSGAKQIASVGAPLDQPVVVQVNDAHGTPVAGASVAFHASNGVVFQPGVGLTGSDGQFTFSVTLGSMAGRYQIAATTAGADGKTVEVKIEEIALGLQQNQGKELINRYCSRCHDMESTPERVSNFDNLTEKPHAFSDGEFLNKMTDADMAAIITRGGPALGKSAEMPPYGHLLGQAAIDAMEAYIRAVSDPPYRKEELIYAQR